MRNASIPVFPFLYLRVINQEYKIIILLMVSVLLAMGFQKVPQEANVDDKAKHQTV